MTALFDKNKLKCPKCGAEVTNHNDRKLDPWGWMADEEKPYVCDGHASRETFVYTDKDGNQQELRYRTKSCGWFSLAELTQAESERE